MKVVICNKKHNQHIDKWYTEKDGLIIDVEDFTEDLYILRGVYEEKNRILLFKEDVVPISYLREKKLKRILEKKQ